MSTPARMASHTYAHCTPDASPRCRRNIGPGASARWSRTTCRRYRHKRPHTRTARSAKRMHAPQRVRETPSGTAPHAIAAAPTWRHCRAFPSTLTSSDGASFRQAGTVTGLLALCCVAAATERLSAEVGSRRVQLCRGERPEPVNSPFRVWASHVGESESRVACRATDASCLASRTS